MIDSRILLNAKRQWFTTKKYESTPVYVYDSTKPMPTMVNLTII